MGNLISHMVRHESGAAAIKNNSIASLISVVNITALTVLGTNLNGDFTSGAGGLL